VKEVQQLESCRNESTRNCSRKFAHHKIADLMVRFAQIPKRISWKNDGTHLIGRDPGCRRTMLSDERRPRQHFSGTERQHSYLPSSRHQHVKSHVSVSQQKQLGSVFTLATQNLPRSKPTFHANRCQRSLNRIGQLRCKVMTRQLLANR